MDPSPRTPPIEPRETLMAGLAPAAAGRAAGLATRLFGRRRRFVIDSAYQIRTAVVAILGMVFLLAFAAVLFYVVGVENAVLLAQKKGPAGRFASGDARSVLYLVATGIIFVAAVFLIEILETHKTAGVVHKVIRGLRDVETGRWGTRVALRRSDNFKELQEAFNAAGRTLRDRVEEDLHGLQGIESRVRLAAREFESGNREGALVLLRRVGAEIQSLRERKRDLLSAGGGPSEGAGA